MLQHHNDFAEYSRSMREDSAGGPMNAPASLTIRSAALVDVPTIVLFNSRLAEETEHKRLDPATIERGVRRALSEPGLCRYFVAERGSEIVGQAMITIELTDWRDGVLWWLQSVYVAKPHRGTGVFRTLFQHIQSLAEADGEVRGLRLYVERENERAQRVYEQLGMRPSGHLVYERDWSNLGAGVGR
jgi:GNAT superfamily N-acetyltransferase